MRKLLSVNSTAPTLDTALLIARLGIAALMLIHGIPKMMMLFSVAPVQFPPLMGMGAELSLSLTVFSEVVCSVFLVAGFATRFAAIPLIITMLVAIFIIHGADPLAKKEPALYFLLVYSVLLIAGSGKYSMDYLLQNKSTKAGHDQKVVDSTLVIYQ